MMEKVVVCDPLAAACGMGEFYSILPQSLTLPPLHHSHWPRRPRLRQWRRHLLLAARRGGNRRGKAMRGGGNGGRLHTWPAVSQTSGGERCIGHLIFGLKNQLRFYNTAPMGPLIPTLPSSPPPPSPPLSCDSSIPFNSNGTTLTQYNQYHKQYYHISIINSELHNVRRSERRRGGRGQLSAGTELFLGGVAVSEQAEPICI